MSKTREFLFTSESVNPGHPDKLCDQVSDAVLDACLAQDAHSHVAVETAVKDNNLILLGEISTNAKVDFEAIARQTVKEIGFDCVSKGMDYKTFKFTNLLFAQSREIANSVHVNKSDEQVGAGDQGIMFGYATDETEEYMPATHILATRLSMRIDECRETGEVSYFRPDAKTQVTMSYSENLETGVLTPQNVHTIVISVQHDDGVCLDQIKSDLMEKVIKPTIPAKYLTEETRYYLNPSGSFVVGGPQGDAGVTGRKIIVDTYGGWGAHGGGAFSGKDYTKVDRSASYYARYIAKSLVAAKLCRRCLVQVSYAIGVPDALSVFVEDYGTSSVSQEELLRIIKSNFDLRPGMLVKELGLHRPIYRNTAKRCHFGCNPDAPWEQIKELKL